MRCLKFTYDDGSVFIAHHGVSGMKWGQHLKEGSETMGNAVNNYLVNPLLGLLGPNQTQVPQNQQAAATAAEAAEATEKTQKVVEEAKNEKAPTLDNEQREQIAEAVIRGDYGNGEERRQALTDAGYDYDTIQTRVNEKVWGLPEGSLSESSDRENSQQAEEDVSERTKKKNGKQKTKNKKKKESRLNDDTGLVEIEHSMMGPAIVISYQDGSKAIAHYGVKGMKHGKHVKATDPSYLLSLGLISPEQASKMMQESGQNNIGESVNDVVNGLKGAGEAVSQGLSKAREWANTDPLAKPKEAMAKEDQWEKDRGLNVPQLKERYERAYNDPRNDDARQRLIDRYSKKNVDGKSDESEKKAFTQDEIKRLREAKEKSKQKAKEYSDETSVNKMEFKGDKKGFREAQRQTDAYFGKLGPEAQKKEIKRREDNEKKFREDMKTRGFVQNEKGTWVKDDTKERGSNLKRELGTRTYAEETRNNRFENENDPEGLKSAQNRTDAYYGKLGREAQRQEFARREELVKGSKRVRERYESESERNRSEFKNDPKGLKKAQQQTDAFYGKSGAEAQRKETARRKENERKTRSAMEKSWMVQGKDGVWRKKKKIAR